MTTVSANRQDSPHLNRDRFLELLQEVDIWDVLIIGGGATGLGTAVDAARRGYRALLIERGDFGQGTSSRSTKLVHGGVRYLRQGNLSLVMEALRERGRLVQNAPHLVRPLPFVVPCYRWWERPYYAIGLNVYDRLSGSRRLGTSTSLSAPDTKTRLPTLTPDGLRGGVCYYDAQFDDARLAVNLAQTAARFGAVTINHLAARSLLKSGGRVSGVVAEDNETHETYSLRARVVVNATGVFADSVRRMDQPDAASMIRPSQGIHLVLDAEFLPGDSALMIPRTDDGRVLFAIPWHNRILLGTTDTPVDRAVREPRALEEEIDFLLRHARRYLTHAPRPRDVLSVFAGLRPLVSEGDPEDTRAISREHVVRVSSSGLVTVTGGKWTTYRRMGQDVVDRAAEEGGLPRIRSSTASLPIHGWTEEPPDPADSLGVYGADVPAVRSLCDEVDHGHERLHPRLPYRRGEVVWAARQEMARTVEDVLSRRLRALLLDAAASRDMAPEVAALLAGELGRDAAWQASQCDAFRALASGYLLDPEPSNKSTPTPIHQSSS